MGHTISFLGPLNRLTAFTAGILKYKINRVYSSATDHELQKQLKDFEAGFDYPLDDSRRFRIMHGKGGDYFSFFTSLGKPVFYTVKNRKDNTVVQVQEGASIVQKCPKEEMVGVICGIIRKFAIPGGRSERAWYLCDLKIKKELQGQHIPLHIIGRVFWRYFQCLKWYFIAMHPAKGSPGAVKDFQHSVFSRAAGSVFVNIYNIGSDVFLRQRNHIENICKGKILFKSMKGKKEFDIFSVEDPESTREWKVLHMQHGPYGEKEASESVFEDPLPGYDNLIAAFENSYLDEGLATIEGIERMGKATLVYHRINLSIFCDTILTNEI
jgi:hypothetical protein